MANKPKTLVEISGRPKLRKVVYRKPRGTSAERGYDSKWQRARKTFLGMFPLCAECERKGNLTPATVVDHIKPHKGDKALFWDMNNWQSLCKPCHDRKTASEDGAWGNPIKKNGQN